MAFYIYKSYISQAFSFPPMPLFLAEVSSGEECLNYIFLCTAEQHISLCWLPTFQQSLISLPCSSPPQKQDQPTFWGQTGDSSYMFMPCWLKASMWKSSCVGRAFAERSLLQHLWPTTGWRLAELPLVTLKAELFCLFWMLSDILNICTPARYQTGVCEGLDQTALQCTLE